MQLNEIAHELRHQIALRAQDIPAPSDDDVKRLIEDNYIREKPHYYSADIGDFIQAWLKHLKDHPRLSITERFKRWFRARIRHVI
jgi:hypothetical protein